MAMNPMAGMGRPPTIGGMPPSMGVAPMGQAPSPQMGGGVAPSTGNVMQITSKLRNMPDAELQQYAAMHKNDIFVFPLAFQESKARKHLRDAKAAQNAGQKLPPVVDQDLAQMMPQALPEEQGIGALNAPNLQNLADGGIAGYADGGPQQPGMFNYAQMAPAVDLHPNSGVTPRSMAAGGIAHFADKGAVESKPDYRQMIIDSAIANGVDPKVALRIAGVEGTGKNSKSSATNFFQFIDKTYKDLGGDPALRHDPIEAIRLGGLFLGKNQRSLEKSLGRTPEPHELYGTHFLGEPVGKALLTANPKQTVAEFLKNTSPKRADDIIRANPEVLGSKGEKTVGDVRNWTKLKMAGLGLPAATASTGLPKETAEYLTNLMPGGAANATEIKPKTAPVQAREPTQAELAEAAQPAFMTPSSGKGRKEGNISKGLQSGQGYLQMLNGAGDVAYDVAGIVPNAVHGAYSLLGGTVPRERFAGTTENLRRGSEFAGIRPPDSTDPTMQGFRTAGNIATSLINPIAGLQTAGTKADAGLKSLAALKVAKEQEALQKTKALRLPESGVTLAGESGQIKIPASQISAETQAIRTGQQQNALQQDMLNAQKATQEAHAAQKAAFASEKAPISLGNLVPAANVVRAGTAATAILPAAQKILSSNTKEQQYPNYNATTEAEDASFGKRAPLDITEDKPLEIAKPATEEKKGRNWDDIMLNTGLGLLAGKSPYALQNAGEAGLNALQIERAQTKEDREQKLAELHGKYYASAGKKAEAEANYLENEKSNTALIQKATAVTEQSLKAWMDSQANSGVPMAPEDIRAVRAQLFKQTLGMMGLQIPSTMASNGPTPGAIQVLGVRPS